MTTWKMSTGKVTMMDAGVRVAAAATVLLGGILMALFFRHESSQTGPLPAETGDRLVLRKRMEPQCAAEPASRRGAARVEHSASASDVAPASGRQATVRKPATLKPIGPGEPPPVLARDYPGDVAPDGQDWTSLPGRKASDANAQGEKPQMHQIADGDTLHALAERYLGSADRFLEIYEANCDLLNSPEILPIGLGLKIPSQQRYSPSPSNFMPKRPLVPVAGGEGEK